MKTFLLSIRLTPMEVVAIDGFVSPHQFRSRSHFITEAIAHYLFVEGTSQLVLDKAAGERLAMRKRRNKLKEAKKCKQVSKKSVRRKS